MPEAYFNQPNQANQPNMAGPTVHVGLMHRVDREDITIIILDTKLVPDFVLHACCFFIAGNRPVLMLLRSVNKSFSDKNRAAKS